MDLKLLIWLGGQTVNKTKTIEDLNKTLNEFDYDIRSEISDGYHTFSELYLFRKVYNAVLFNQWFDLGLYDVHKSKLHSDGQPPFGKTDMFIVVSELTQSKISNHYHESDWNYFDCDEREKANEYDGHTSNDVINRLQDLITTDLTK